MTAPTELCRVLTWDSAFFGKKIAEVVPRTLDHDAIIEIGAWCEATAVDCLCFLCDGDDTSVRIAERAGFARIDVRLTLERVLSAEPEPELAPVKSRPGFRVRDALDADRERLERLAASSHHDSRFYRDERFGVESADELFRTWIRNSMAGWAQDVLVLADADDVARGYITGHRKIDEGTIGLIAVEPEARGGGGRALVSSLCERYRRDGLARMSVVTQELNVAAQRLYERAGFVTRSKQLWYHRWWSR